MELVLLLALTAISGLFIIANSFSAERSNLFPAAGIMLLAGGILLTGPGLQIQQGTDYSYTEHNNKTVVGEESPVYEKVDPFEGIEFSSILGLIYMVTGTGYIVMASPGRFRTLLSRR